MASKQSPTMKVGDIDTEKLSVGQKTQYKNAPGFFLPVKYGNSMNKYQVRGLYVTFAGHKKELKDAEKKDPASIAYWINIDITKTDCKFLPNGKNDAEAFLKYNKALDTKILERLGKRFKLGKQPDGGEFNSYYSLVSEGQKKKDSEEYYNDSIKLPLMMKKSADGKSKVEEFETKFINAETKEVMNITPKNIMQVIHPGTYCIAIVDDSRVWLGGAVAKLTRKVIEMKLLLADESQNVSDDFVGTVSSSAPSTATAQQVTAKLDSLLPSVSTPTNSSSVSNSVSTSTSTSTSTKATISETGTTKKKAKKAKVTNPDNISKSTEDTEDPDDPEDAEDPEDPEDADIDISIPTKTKGKK